MCRRTRRIKTLRALCRTRHGMGRVDFEPRQRIEGELAAWRRTGCAVEPTLVDMEAGALGVLWDGWEIEVD